MKILVIFISLIVQKGLADERINPDLSVSVLGVSRYSNFGNNLSASKTNGFHLQEAEIRATSNIDSYFRGDAVFSIEKSIDSSTGAESYSFNPEEVFIETLNLPSTTIRTGKFYALIDRHNNLHTHSFPFIDAPLPNQLMLGDEGLNGTGVWAAILIPTSWYFEVVPQFVTGYNNELYNSPAQDDGTSLLFTKNLWDLSDTSTFELDLTHGVGQNQWDGKTQLTSVAFTYKWRPLQKSTYKSFSLTGQHLVTDRANATGDDIKRGYSLWFQWQFAKRWWFQGRNEAVGNPQWSDSSNTQKNSWLIGFVPTEYSAIRLQYDNLRAPATETEHIYTLQFNVSLGMHPAHAY